jgi:hypothetical protein
MGYPDVGRLPWWEYARALRWLTAGATQFHLTLQHARHLFDDLHDFCRTLAEAGVVSGCRELERARSMLCSRRGLRLLARLPWVGGDPWSIVKRPNGQRMLLSGVDVWLCVLWRHYGRSWCALERRVTDAPGGAEKRGAVAHLRARLTVAGCSEPPDVPSETARAGLEDALRWLDDPGPGGVGAPTLEPDEEMADLSTAMLLRRLQGCVPWMPRREMQELIRRGAAAVPGLEQLIRDREHNCSERAVLWAIVVLGELRHPSAIEVLGTCLGSEGLAAGEAAAEALGKIGAPAVPLLERVTAQGERRDRLYANSALGMIHTESAYRCLVQALARDPDLGDVIAHALRQHGRGEAIEILHERMGGVPSWMRPEFESAIFSLVHGRCTRDCVERDWRLRYRPLPVLDWSFAPSWVTIAALIRCRRKDGGEEASRGQPGPRSLAEIISDPKLAAEEGNCRRCRGPIWRPTGVPVCRHTALKVVARQRCLLERWLGAGLANAWAALDACDVLDVARQPSVHCRSRRDSLTSDALALGRATLHWLVALKREDLCRGASYLRVISDDLAALYGGGATSAHPSPPS